MPIDFVILFLILAFVLGYLLGLNSAKGYLRKAQQEADQDIARVLREVEKARLQ